MQHATGKAAVSLKRTAVDAHIPSDRLSHPANLLHLGLDSQQMSPIFSLPFTDPFTQNFPILLCHAAPSQEYAPPIGWD
jgi:hypothetical protein